MIKIMFLNFKMDHKWYINVTQSERLSPSSVKTKKLTELRNEYFHSP